MQPGLCAVTMPQRDQCQPPLLAPWGEPEPQPKLTAWLEAALKPLSCSETTIPSLGPGEGAAEGPVLGTAPHLQGRLWEQRAAPCVQQRCILCTATAEPNAGPWLSSRFHLQHKNVVLELAAKADLAALALRLAWGAELCQGAARLREEMAFHEPKFHFCMELCPGRLRLSQVGLIILPASPTCCTSPTWFLAAPTRVGGCVRAGCALCPCRAADVFRRYHAKGSSAPCSHECLPSCCIQNSLGFCTGKATGMLVPQRAHAVCRAYTCIPLWEVLGKNRSWAEHAAGPGH